MKHLIVLLLLLLLIMALLCAGCLCAAHFDAVHGGGQFTSVSIPKPGIRKAQWDVCELKNKTVSASRSRAIYGGNAIAIKQRDPLMQAELYFIGSSSIRPYYYRCTSPNTGGIVMSGKSVSGLVKTEDSDRKLLLDSLKRVKPKNILLSFGMTDLYYLYPLRIWGDLDQNKSPLKAPEDPILFAKTVAEKYLKLLHDIYNCHPANIYILLPNYNPLDGKQLRQSLINNLKWFTTVKYCKDLLYDNVMNSILSRDVRNQMIDIFNLRVKDGLKDKKHFHAIDINPYVSSNGVILSNYRMASPLDPHLAVDSVLNLVKSLLPHLSC